MRIFKILFLAVCLVLFIGNLHEVIRAEPRVPQSADEICPALPGSKLPALTLQRMDGSELDLSQEVRRKPTVLIFYRGGW
jgi:hypothetical protein